MPLVRTNSTSFTRNADGWGGCIFAILDSAPGIVIPTIRVSTEPAHASTPRGARVTLHGEDQRDDDQRRCDGERDPHTDGNILGMRSCHVTRPRGECEDSAHHGCAGNEAKIARQVEHA